MEAFLANLKHAIRNRETVTIGGGAFSPDELKEVVAALESLQAKTEALEEIAQMMEGHPDAQVGSSKVHYCMHKARSVAGRAEVESPRSKVPKM